MMRRSCRHVYPDLHELSYRHKIGRVDRYAFGIDQTEAEVDNVRQRFGKETLVFTLTSVFY
jgi:hypothetical protein